MEANNTEIEERLENLSPLAVAMDGNILVKPDDWFWLQEMVDKQQQEIERLKAFHDYFRELYGEGLEVANWHLNGDLEPFDDIFNSAEEEMDK